ncbi:prefoldin subunit [Candidatus Micrarchaeota archaeon]|nr:prefoldin subunit [Candidatus Micrarchaeota archaeon]
MAREFSEQQKQDIVALENSRRGLQLAQAQRSRFELEVAQIDAAAEELGKSPGKVYKTIGGVLAEAKADELKKELSARKSAIATHIENLKKEEKKFGDKASELTRKVEASIKGS